MRSRVESIARDGGHWVASFADGSTMTSAAIILTAPVPQALALLDA
jgi:predicted NAD/FAD-dependent oxidoreductase